MEDDFTDHEATDYADYTDYGVFPSRGRRAFTPAARLRRAVRVTSSVIRVDCD